MRSFTLRTSRTQMGQTQTSESCRRPGPEIYPVIYPAILVGPYGCVAVNGNGLGPSRRSVCAAFVLEVGVRLRVDAWWLYYVRAKNLKWSNDDT